jgi:hypothetical protein
MTMKLTVVLRGEVVAALDEDGLPLRAEVRPVLTTPKGGVITVGKTWMGKHVIVVELPPRKGER